MDRILLNIAAGVFWMVAAGLALAMVAGVGAVIPMGIYIAPLGGAMMLMVTATAMLRLRRRRSAAVLGYLEQAVRMNQPLPQVLSAAGRGERGTLRTRLAQIQRRLEAGASLGDAVRLGVPELPPRVVSIIDAADRTGRLPQALARLVRAESAATRRDLSSSVIAAVYPLMILVVVCSVLGFLGTFVLPKFNRIYEDFGAQIPRSTQWVLVLGDSYGWLIGALAALALLACAGWGLRSVVHGGMHNPHPRRQRRLDDLIAIVPGVGRVVRDGALADVFDTVGDSLDAGLPADRAVSQAAELDINGSVKRQVERWAAGVASGTSLHEAAATAGLPSFASGILAMAAMTPRPGDACRFLARHYAARVSVAAALLRGAIIPFMVIAVGLFTGWIVFSLFLPITTLIWNEMPGGGGGY